jgi:putative membrane protein
MYGYHTMNGYGRGWSIVMILVWLVFLCVSAIVVAHLLKSHCHHLNSDHKTDPVDIAKERYAKGEITKEQFEQIKKDLA